MSAAATVGKVNAAITTQMMIDRFEVERIINTGIAGAVHHDLKVLDVSAHLPRAVLPRL